MVASTPFVSRRLQAMPLGNYQYRFSLCRRHFCLMRNRFVGPIKLFLSLGDLRASQALSALT